MPPSPRPGAALPQRGRPPTSALAQTSGTPILLRARRRQRRRTVTADRRRDLAARTGGWGQGGGLLRSRGLLRSPRGLLRSLLRSPRGLPRSALPSKKPSPLAPPPSARRRLRAREAAAARAASPSRGVVVAAVSRAGPERGATFFKGPGPSSPPRKRLLCPSSKDARLHSVACDELWRPIKPGQ